MGCRLLGYPEGAAGNIASGGSIANLTAIATARDAHGLKSADFPRVVVYLTGQAHHSISKRHGITGLGKAQFVTFQRTSASACATKSWNKRSRRTASKA